ncbi:MAG TPA: MBG domain-containing protein, partial [Acidimicrobiales bacterium]|nr:MBG domain-containing protein [Acidimicrobiales bacterium]
MTSSTMVSVLTSLPAAADANELYSWGYNFSGQLGNGNTTNQTTPVKVQLPAGVVATAAASGGSHSLAIGSDGKLYAWGDNSVGELGNGTTTSSITPVVVSMPAGVTATAIAAGLQHSVAVGSDGNVYDWGYNGFGQLATGDLVDSDTPVKVSLGAGNTVVKVAAGAYFTLALTSGGNVWGWGYGAMGTLCDGKVTNPQKTPVQATVSGISAIAAGGYHSLFLTTAGTVFACGYNAFGQLGDNSVTNRATRVQVQLPSGVTATAIAAGQYHSLAIGSNGHTYAWGENSNGQLGDGNTSNSTIPVIVNLPSGVTATAIAGGNTHSLAIGSNGNLYAWGYNGLGELGDGNTTDSSTPVQVGLTPVAKPPSAVASGSSADHSFAIAPPTPASTTTTLTASPTSATYGQSVTLTATLNRSDGGGSVKFLNGASTISGCSAVALTLVSGSYKATCTTSFTAGTQPLSAVYSGDSLYSTSTSSTVNYVVNPAPLLITASSASSTYGSAPAAVTASYSGFVNGDSATSLTTQPTCSTTATASSPAGSYPTSCSGASSPNYTITYANGTQTVGTAPLTITASSGTSTYGSAPPAVTASYSGFVNGDSATSLTHQPTCSTTASSSSPVGTYPTSCSGAVDANYAISYVAGSMVVGTAPLLITASSASTTYGTAPPAVTPSYSGFVNGDNASSLSTAPTCSTTATAHSSVGSYPTSCSGAVDPNYSISYQGGTDTVHPAPLTITASSGSMTYGGSVPTVTPIVSGLQNGESPSVLGAGLTCSTSATPTSAVGSYPTSCSGAVDANYAITYVNGTLVVNPASLTITASSGSMTYGGTVPTITANVSGLQNGESPSVLGAGLTCSTTATPTSPAGT